jgi:hypothetical protein
MDELFAAMCEEMEQADAAILLLLSLPATAARANMLGALDLHRECLEARMEDFWDMQEERLAAGTADED